MFIGPDIPPKNSGVVPEWWKVHARNPDRALPGGIFAERGPDGETITTPTDHRMLWHVRDTMLGAALTPYLRELFSFINDYLAATCQHHWKDSAGDDAIAAHCQCLWCNDVEWKNS